MTSARAQALRLRVRPFPGRKAQQQIVPTEATAPQSTASRYPECARLPWRRWSRSAGSAGRRTDPALSRISRKGWRKRNRDFPSPPATEGARPAPSAPAGGSAHSLPSESYPRTGSGPPPSPAGSCSRSSRPARRCPGRSCCRRSPPPAPQSTKGTASAGGGASANSHASTQASAHRLNSPPL